MSAIRSSPNASSLEAPRESSILRALFDAIPGRAAFLDPQLRYRLVNQEFADTLGLTETVIVGKSVEEILSKEAAGLYRSALPSLASGRAQRWRRWTERRQRFVEEELKPFGSSLGTLQGVVCVSRDLSHAEDQTKREKIHSAVVDSAIDCIVVADADGRVLEFNPASVKTFGYTREQAVGKTIAELIVPLEMRASHEAGMKRFRNGGPHSVIGRRVEVEAMRADGSRIPIELAITAVGAGESALFTAHLRDLRPSRAANAEIERQREALYQSEKLAALGSLLAGVAHELNNPLSIVIGQALMLREAAEARAHEDSQFENIAERGAKIETAANRCARIVKTFLAMARQREAERGKVEVSNLVERVLDLLSYGLRSAGIELKVDIPQDLPPLWADSDQLHQVLLNMVVNAKQALETQTGLRFVSIVARESADASGVEIRVSDNGPGVPEAIRKRIFEPFFTTKPQGVGTGVGLAVSRGLIEAHGGTLSLETRNNGGAIFVIRLPIGTEAIANREPTMDASELIPAPRRRRALIVDDELEIAGLLVEILRRLAFDCELASSGDQAKLRIGASAEAFDLILCDIRMPNGDGPAFYDWLGAKYPALSSRTAFLTGDVLGPAADRFIVRSGRPVIEKPFMPEDIRQIVELICDGNSA
jgi:PAS domain S-box-containing protein